MYSVPSHDGLFFGWAAVSHPSLIYPFRPTSDQLIDLHGRILRLSRLVCLFLRLLNFRTLHNFIFRRYVTDQMVHFALQQGGTYEFLHQIAA